MTRKMIGIVIAGATLAVVALFVVLAPILPTRSQEAPSAELQRLPDIVPSGPVSQDPNAAPLKLVFLGAPIVEEPSIRDPDELYSTLSAVVATLLERKSFYYKDRSAVVTWYKFGILENLSARLARISTPGITPPEEMLPLNSDQFLLVKYGGTVVIDSVAFSTSEGDTPAFSPSEHYLLFVSINPDGVAAWADAGGRAIFTVGPGGRLKPINQKAHPLSDDITIRLQSSVDELRRDIRNRFSSE